MAERPSSASLAGSRALRRYSRHLLIPEVGLTGQEKLACARVLCIGAGGLGSPVLQYLAAAGVGRIGIVDDDTVDETNLQRQTLFTTADIGLPKVQIASERLQAMNPQVAIDRVGVRFDASNARALVSLYDVVVDCTDLFETRYLINDACVLEGRPDVYGSIFRFDGQVSVFDAKHGPCYRCLFPEPPPGGSVPSCAEGGVLGVLAGIIGTFQASEVLKLLLQIGDPLRGRLLLVDALTARVREVAIESDPTCAVCGSDPSITDALAISQDLEPASRTPEIEANQLADAMRDAILLDVREPHEVVFGVLPGAVHIPATQLEARMHELDSSRRYVVACRVGQKSRWALRRLQDAGFAKLLHLSGGLLAYAVLDPDFEFF